MNPQEPYRPTPQPTQPSPDGLPPVLTPAHLLPVQPEVPLSPFQNPQPYPSNPVDNDPSPTMTVDYLNQIAPAEQAKVHRFAIIGLIGGVLLAALFILILIANSGGPSANELLPPLAGRIETLQSVTADQQAHLSENQISEANASLSSALSSMDTDIQAIMKDRGVKKTSSKTAISDETAYKNALSKTLDDSYQRGTLDRTYTAHMTYELTILNSQIAALRQATTNATIRSFCDSATTNINLILKTYSSFDATKQ